MTMRDKVIFCYDDPRQRGGDRSVQFQQLGP